MLGKQVSWQKTVQTQLISLKGFGANRIYDETHNAQFSPKPAKQSTYSGFSNCLIQTRKQ